MLSREVLRAAGQWAWNQLQGASTPSPGAPGRTHNPLEKWTDHDLVRAAAEGGEGSGAVQIEMMRRLKDSLDGEHRSVVAATRRGERLIVPPLWGAIRLGAPAPLEVVVAPQVVGWKRGGRGRAPPPRR